jgi:peptidoglycan glycosyltransferase
MVQTLVHGDLSYFNAENINKEQPLLERPIQGLYVPGSTYKTMTLMAGLDSGHTNLNEPFDKDHALGTNNAVVYDGQPFGPVGNNLTPYTFRFPVTTEYGYTHSDNIIFAQIGVHTGASTWLDYNNRFYVGRTIPFDLSVQPSSVLPNGKQTLADNELAADAFGQGSDFITPMQMSVIDNTVANNGALMQPMVVMRIDDPSKTPVKTNVPIQLSAPISQQTATEVRQGMYGVVRCGSGSLTEVNFVGSPWSIIGKTGTAELGNGKPAHGWLITSAPYDINNPSQLPALTIVAMKENGGEGGAAVGPMIAAMYNDIFTTVKKNDVQMPPRPSTQYCCTSKLLQLGCAP